ncbi:aminomethyl-transferring glycine dehydrogenase subunit GcvPA [Aerococcaceae bacterium WGS1372]
MKKFRYLPHTDQDRQKMLETIGVESVDELFVDVPESIRTKEAMDLDPALSEYELLKHSQKLAKRNANASDYAFFIGAGTYDHHIPSVVQSIISRQEFLTAYVPYQPEISQGELQALFEWQSMICELTQMEVANCGMYDGYNAIAEAANLAINVVRKSSKVLISGAVNPQGINTLNTYAFGKEYGVEEIPLNNDVTDLNALEESLDESTAAVIIQYPNFFGSIEDLKTIREIVDKSKALLIVAANPLALGLLEAPGSLGADIVVGDVQPFGISMSYGGPHCGYFASTQKLMRKLPSRIVGQTTDQEGQRGFVMTLSTREQHIRREKATSNYSSNQALYALASAVAMAALGKQGIVDMASINTSKAHYMSKQLQEKGFTVLNSHPFFNEFVIQLDQDVEEVNRKLYEHGFIGGYDASKMTGQPHSYLLCVTEKRTRQEIDEFVSVLTEVTDHA